MIEPKEFINYKNKDYFFITKENIDGKEIYHYLCEEMIDYIIDDDKYESIDINNPPVFSMFISYENNQYNVVEDKKLIKKYIKEFGMEPELIAYDIALTINLMTLAAGAGYLYGKFKPFRLDKNTRQEFKEQQKKSLKDLKEKLNVDIDLDRINKKIDKLKLLGLGNEKAIMMGLYHPIFNKSLFPISFSTFFIKSLSPLIILLCDFSPTIYSNCFTSEIKGLYPDIVVKLYCKFAFFISLLSLHENLITSDFPSSK